MIAVMKVFYNVWPRFPVLPLPCVCGCLHSYNPVYDTILLWYHILGYIGENSKNALSGKK